MVARVIRIVLFAALLLSLLTLRPLVFGSSALDLKGKPAPAFSLKTVDGKSIALADTKGSVVLIDFWASWCPPCRKLFMHVQSLGQDAALRKQGLRILAINAREPTGRVLAFLDNHPHDFDILLDHEGTAMNDFGVRGLPATFIVGRDGVIREVFTDIAGGPQEIDEAIRSALAEK